MLLGLAVLIVGIVVFSAYQSAENTLLLRSKYRTEKVSVAGSGATVVKREFAGWNRASADLYKTHGASVEIPFTAHDTPVYARENSIDGVYGELGSSSRSAAQDYTYDAHYPRLFGLRGYAVEKTSGINAFDAAHLASRDGVGDYDDDEAGSVSGDRLYNSGLLRDVFRRLIGRLPSPGDNASNLVYLPLGSTRNHEE